ncbi:hypothetical protein C2E31_03445 [Rhodopirellula baltica]|nr:hypothetical protein C2E31_03445 [Rhodopirellula baltica]
MVGCRRRVVRQRRRRPETRPRRLVIHQGSVGVDVKLISEVAGNAGLIIATNQAKVGADNFSGYEIALDSQADRLVIGRHDHNFNLIGYEAIDVRTDEWIRLRVKIEPESFTVFVNDKEITTVRDQHPLRAGTIGFRQWQRNAQYRNLELNVDGNAIDASLVGTARANEISGMWDAVGDVANASFQLIKDNPFVGQQSQRISAETNGGSAGLANRGLNRWGMTFRNGKPYEGQLWLRSDKAIAVSVTLEGTRLEDTAIENNNEVHELASKIVNVSGDGKWNRYDFELTPTGETENGRFAIRLQDAGQLDIGYAFLQPGSWGRYKDLPLRRDVVEGLIDQGITVLRYGGSMVDNPPNYRWKNMIGPRDQRQPYDGHWYDYSTNGWGIIDFLNLCEATGIFGIPCFSIDESPQDMVDFLEYANGDANSTWGQKRVADGHPKPYGLQFIQLGNEESVNEAYWDRYEPIARAMWKQDPSLTLIVGDFQFESPIVDPFHFTGSPAGITSLAAHQKILALAKELDTEVWFDTHMWTGGPEPTSSMNAFFTYVDALEKLAEGAKHKVVVFEFNANNHRQRRALSNAEMIGRIMRDGRIPITLSANCLQPDGQNDNGWDQGLLFLNSSDVWLQPPGFVTQMVSQAYQPWVVQSSVASNDKQAVPESIDVVATASEDKQTVIVRVANRDAHPVHVQLLCDGIQVQSSDAQVTTLAAPLNAHNTADNPNQIHPTTQTISIGTTDQSATIEVPAYSFSTIRIGS